MLVWLILGLAALSVFAIAMVFVGWGVDKTRTSPPQITIDINDAIDFCSEALPDDVTAQISYEDLRRLMRYHLEWIQFHHWSPEGTGELPIVYEGDDAAGYVARRAEFWHLDVSRDQIDAVVEANDAFLQYSGAIGVADPELASTDLAELAAALDAGADPAELAGTDKIRDDDRDAVSDWTHQEEGGGPTANQ